MTGPTTTTTSSARSRALEEPAARRQLVEADLEAMPGLRDLLEDLRLWPDLDAELDRCRPPLLVAPHPGREVRRRHGVYFDPAEVARFVQFCRRLRHTKGRWAGRPLVPDLWQIVYVIGPVFGWRQEGGARYFRELYLEVPRKNGKSTLCAAIALYLLMCDSNLAAGRKYEPGAEVYSAAATTRQAKEVFRPAEAMARRSPALARRLGFDKDVALVYERTTSRYEVLSGQASRGEEKMGLNPSGFVFDELHVIRNASLIDTIESGTGAREHPLGVFITTAGSDEEGTPYDVRRTDAEAICTGEIVEARTWAVIYTIPDELADRWAEPEVHAMANPGYGISVGEEYLAEQVKKAKRSEAKRLSFCRLHLNRRTGSLVRFIDVDAYDRCDARFLAFTEDEIAGRPAYGGLDLASSTDLAALALVVPSLEPWHEDPDKYVEYLDVVVRAWTPAESLRRRTDQERRQFVEWIRAGALLTTPGDVIDYDTIEAEAYALAERFELRRAHFDRWGSKQIIDHLAEGGLSMWPMGQGFASMSAPTKELERLILQGRIRTNGHPVLRHAVRSLVARMDPAGNVKPDRDKSTGRIDPAVAVIMAIGAWLQDNRGSSVYEERGVVTA